MNDFMKSEWEKMYMEQDSPENKEKYLRKDEINVSDYYKNYMPKGFEAWMKDHMTLIIVVIAVIFLYLVIGQIMLSFFFGSDVSQTEIVNGLKNM